MASIGGLGRVLRVHVQVLQQHRLREGGLVVDARAPISMAAGADFEVEGAVDSAGKCGKLVNLLAGGILRLSLGKTYLSFSVPKIEARYSAILMCYASL